MRGFALAFAVTAGLALVGAAGASQWMPPSRPLTRDERLAIAIREAEAIVIGRLVSSYDTTVTRSGGPAPAPMRFAIMQLEPERWLKGPGGKSPLMFCDLSGDEMFSVDAKTGQRGPERSERGRRVVVFMSGPAKDPDAGPETALGALQRSCRWVTGVISINPYDDIPPVSPADSAFVVEVERGLSRQSSTALARGADVIVLARVPDGGARPGGTSVDIEVRRALVGDAAPGLRLRIDLVAPHASKFKGRTGLWFLRRAPVGGYALLELSGGILDVVGDRVPMWNLSLAEAERRIARARTR